VFRDALLQTLVLMSAYLSFCLKKTAFFFVIVIVLEVQYTITLYAVMLTFKMSLKSKVDGENRAYKGEWKDNYVFLLPSFVNA